MLKIVVAFFTVCVCLSGCSTSEKKPAPAAIQQQNKGSVPSEQATTKVTRYYSCPMHPEISRESPGKCPKCGMELQETTAVDASMRGK